LWLIGLWERSSASRTIKQWTGNPEAAASAYSLYDYDVAADLGGWDALANLRERCLRRGIRLGSDMVPNHTGIDSRWMIERPDRFLQLPYSPFPSYNYGCGNLSGRDDVTVQIEDRYFDRTDAAVVFKRIDNNSGETRYIYHGNDGTSMPWNDTAQIDFLNPEAREAVIRTIIGVCKQFTIVRFDAAMTLAKRHIQRLWYPAPGQGGDIASRAEHALSNDEFNARIPHEFWREVVDRCAAEAPDTLLLAEAFWMMEGYFVRTLGMHRVYNSAFMNMLKNEDNAKYRATIKNTLEFDPEILKRFVNFMNNPDEDTAVAQFGKGDKYFGICSLLVTMPGLPMFGHGQIEGFEEKYGMEYRRSYRDEEPDGYLVDRHEREIFPLARRRALFAGSADFRLYDLYAAGGGVNENVFAYSNGAHIGGRYERALVFYNNSFEETSGWIKASDPAIPRGDGSRRRDSLGEALALSRDDRYFTLFRDQKSGLWYIRSSKAIHENGFFVALGGYGAQIFLDIHEVADDEKGRWARLNHDLQGRGVPDPRSAIMDIYLGDLYYRFDKMMSPKLLESLCAFFAKGKSSAEEARAFVDSLKENAEQYFECARRFISGADGSFDPWPASDGETRKPAGADDLWKEFSAYVEGLLSLARGAKADTPEGRFRASLAREMKARPHLCAAAFGYGLLAILRPILGAGATGAEAAGLAFAHWELGRKLRERLSAAGSPGDGVSGDGAERACRIAKAVLRRSRPEIQAEIPAGASAGQIAGFIVKENSASEDFLEIIGANIYDGVQWFNKERFEEALLYGKLFVLLDCEAGTKNAALLGEVAEALERAKEASGYRLDALSGKIQEREKK
ncbi:MAG: alpha-amylase family glycosyl hydrolase, partial [Treponema sp.]|nr:alpha-amylase family glycosyl hydrolase [Treponema sp.]